MATKTHNWTTSGKVVDAETSRLARDFIDAATFLTPAVEAELYTDKHIGMGTPDTDAKPSKEYVEAEEENWDDGDEPTPDKTAFEKRD